jgi:hypothetical protein
MKRSGKTNEEKTEATVTDICLHLKLKTKMAILIKGPWTC